MAEICFREFSCYYKLKKGYAVALDHISLTVRDGELLALVGTSGCGKTTMLKVVLGLIEYTEGELTIDGSSVDTGEKRDANFAYVSQEYSLYPQMTVYDNIAFPLRMMHTPQRELDARVKAVAERLEVEWLLTRKPRQLSGGQHQRVAIARALVKYPRVLLMDEPFSNLEPKLRLELRRLVGELHREQGLTCIFVTHDLDEAFQLGDRIAVMEQGELLQVGTPEELRLCPKSGLLRRHLQG